MRLIDADAFYKAQKERCGDNVPFVGTCSADNSMLYLELEKAPTVDAVPVRHGKWLSFTNDDGKQYEACSECEYTKGIGGANSWCPACGALMKVDGE